jgi:DNA-binding response OmpR family regulator
MAKRILIVDDDEMVRMAISELLKPEGYEIDSVGSAKEALDKIEEEKYDLLLLDIIMPQMDGLELCRRIRAKKDLAEVPIIFLTAKSREQDRIEGMEAGANLFLSKPISPAKLVEVVSETIG